MRESTRETRVREEQMRNANNTQPTEGWDATVCPMAHTTTGPAGSPPDIQQWRHDLMGRVVAVLYRDVNATSEEARMDDLQKGSSDLHRDLATMESGMRGGRDAHKERLDGFEETL